MARHWIFPPPKECRRRPLGGASGASSGSVALSFHQPASTMRLADVFVLLFYLFSAEGRKRQIVVEPAQRQPVRINTETWMSSGPCCVDTMDRDSCFAHSHNSRPTLLLIIKLFSHQFSLFFHILVPIRSSLCCFPLAATSLKFLH